MKNSFSHAPLSCFQVHPEVAKSYRDKNLDGLQFTIEKYGQQTPVKVIERDGQMYIIDGVSRFICAKQLMLPSLIYVTVQVEDDKVIEFRMLSNVKTKRTFTEICIEAEYILGTIGKSQGKKRQILGLDEMDNNEFFGEAGKDRFDLTCALMGIEMKGSTLRKGMQLFFEEFNPNGKSESGIIELLDKNRISIGKAYKLKQEKDRKKFEKEKTEQAKLFISHSNLNGEYKPYKLFNKSSLIMDEIPDDSIDLIIDSHPYWGLKEYTNQDELMHGQEPNLEEYLQNFRSFNAEKLKKLRPGGVLATIIGETYRDGYQGVVMGTINSVKKVGFTLIDDIAWIKKNQTYTPHPYRFLNSKETIILAYKPGAEPYFKEVKRQGSVDNFKIKETSTNGYYVANPETCIPNVIITPAFNPSELRKIDPDFRHDAPCHPLVYKILTEAYSKPGDTILDGFVGAGTVGVALSMGRNVVGFDVDPLSIVFAQKRFERFLCQTSGEGEKSDQNHLSVAA
jgi:DNA modification methylase